MHGRACTSRARPTTARQRCSCAGTSRASDAEDGDDDQAADDDRDAVVAALQEQNTALQRRVQANEAEIAKLAKPNWLKTLAKAGAGLAAGAGIAVLVIKRRKD